MVADTPEPEGRPPETRCGACGGSGESEGGLTRCPACNGAGAEPEGRRAPQPDTALREAVRQMIGALRETPIVAASEVEHYLPIMGPVFRLVGGDTEVREAAARLLEVCDEITLVVEDSATRRANTRFRLAENDLRAALARQQEGA